MIRNKINVSFLWILTILLLFSCSTKDQPWESLFNGEDLTGWHKKGGKANYYVEHNSIIGETVSNTPNTFLCTDSEYSDFILELEFKVDPLLNSGIQIRSSSYPEYKNGKVHGYQVEIDPSQRAWTGRIYDEARRGWLYPIKDNEAAQRAFKQGQWNKFRIEALDDTIKTWINGVPAAHLEDDMTLEGFIGLQVHGIGNNKEKEGITVAWRNIRIITENPMEYAREMELPPKNMYNKLTQNEIDAGWELLFDGKSSQGWRGAEMNKFPESGWEIKNGVLTIHASGGGESEKAGDIVTIDKYSCFDLKVDFKMTEGANSGIKYYVDTELNKGKGSAIGLEYQILDDSKHPDAQLGSHGGSRTLASLYDLIKAENKFPRPIGEWNHARIVSDNSHVEHWLNGRKVLEYERGSKKFRKRVAESKYKKWENFGEWEEGHILLQEHGYPVSFRNIKIRRFD